MLCETGAVPPTPTSGHRHNVPAARDLRGRETGAENLLWAALRGRRLAGLKFRRQHPIGPFVLDFCCVDRRLAIELDGQVHATQQAHDADREALLIAVVARVLRFPNAAVRDDLSQVLAAIQTTAREDPGPRPPAPGRAAGWS
jgi:very-short-patch-repair endonuclease